MGMRDKPGGPMHSLHALELPPRAGAGVGGLVGMEGPPYHPGAGLSC